MAFTKTNIENARKELEVALRTVGTRLGVDFNVGIIRYDSSTFRCKLEAKAHGSAAVGSSTEMDAVAYHRLGPKFDENKTYLSLSLGRVKIIGFNRRAKKYPFIVETVKGKKYKISSLSAQSIVDGGPVA